MTSNESFANWKGACPLGDARGADPGFIEWGYAFALVPQLMAERKIGCLPVLSEGKLVGILTEGDFVASFAQALGPASDLHGLPP